MDLRIVNVVKAFDRFPALHGVSLDIRSGELLALLGPSGSGKTTLLRLIAGLEIPTAGEIWFGNENASALSVRARNIGFVFQSFHLLPRLAPQAGSSLPTLALCFVLAFVTRPRNAIQ